MLWNLIRDFFVMHVFGGITSTGVVYLAQVGNIASFDNGVYEDYWNASADEVFFNIGFYTTENGIRNSYIGLSDWLSTTATAISITIIVVLCCLFIYKIIRLVGGLIR